MRPIPKLLELRPNRSLLNSDFDGYKLSLTEIPTITSQLKEPVHRLAPDSNQYSLLHAKLYGLHNFLIGEPEGTECVYFIDKAFNVNKFSIEGENNQFTSEILWQIPRSRDSVPGDYNVSLKFASEKYAVLGDGVGSLYILDRGNGQKWTIVFSGEVIGPEEKFVISDVVYREAQKPEMHLLLTSIQQKNANERHSTALHWITLEKSDTWNQVQLRELTVKGFVQYANLERSCEAIYVISDSGCKFTLDSENEICEEPKQDQEIKKKFKWTQGREDVTIKFSLSQAITKNLVNVRTELTRIEVKYQDEVLLEGPLYQRIDPEMTTWTMQDSTLEVVLQKQEIGLMWPEVVEGDASGEFVPDPALVGNIAERLAPLTSEEEVSPASGTTFNSQQIEECDFETDKLTIFKRISRSSHQVTHKINLGSHQVLLTLNLERGSPLALGVRSDVDICVWEPKQTENDFCLEHRGTLLALGYIQASKQQMKFLVSSPDFNYAIICESTRHVFIYCQNKTNLNELRNRVTGRRVSSVAQQQVYSLPSTEEILGVYASNSYLYVLRENFLTALKL